MAIERGIQFGCTAIQMFAKNNKSWFSKGPTDAEAEQFRNALNKSPIQFVFTHAGYLINLASPDDEIHGKSMQSMKQELDYADKLGIPWVNVHPGAHRDAGEEAGIATISDSIKRLLDDTADSSTGILLEATAGQGTSLGHRFEQLAAMLDQINAPARMGICIDTCHIFAAGYDLRTEESYSATMAAFTSIVGLEHLKAFHFNDSKFDLGTHKDRHEHIGEGFLGRAPFEYILNDPKVMHLPMVLETPKGDDGAEDIRNLTMLYQLIR